MKKTKVNTLISKFAGKDNPYKAIIPFLLATVLFAATITPLYAQLTQITPSVNENQKNLTTTEKTTASSMKPETPQPTVVLLLQLRKPISQNRRILPVLQFRH